MDLLDLLSSEEACSGRFRMVRWRSGVYCPRCGSRKVKGYGNCGRGLTPKRAISKGQPDFFPSLLREIKT